ncbi:MAG: ABC transporter substrate-binding protein, partial [Candidatus Limnocylindrales bacterium]
AVAATALRSRTVDWMLQVVPDQAVALATDPSLRVSAHPEPAVRTIIFNVRPGRVFADAVARRAFALCLDRDVLVRDATAGAALSAHVETGPRSWAVAGAAPPIAPDPGGAATLLETAGWARDDDGIFSRDGERLSGLIYVRPSRVDLLAFARAASEALRVCGIDLQVVEQDQPGDLLLGQLQWPNDFETVLVTRPVGVDPDIDFQAFAGDHVTSAENPADANPGGYASVTLDRLLAEARTSTDSNGRAALYAQVADRLAQEVPSYPIWYDASFAAISSIVRAEGADVDLQRPRYWWSAWSWDLAP